MRNKRAVVLPPFHRSCARVCAALAVLALTEAAQAQNGPNDVPSVAQQPNAPSSTAASAPAPLSAIDWLSASVSAPTVQTQNGSPAPTPLGEAPVTGGIAPPQTITTTVLDRPNRNGVNLDGVGVLSPAQTGFPRALWGNAQASDVASAIAGLDTGHIPALQSLAVTLLLAEAEPPTLAPNIGEGAPTSAVLMARIDKLLAMGALDQAYALIEAAGPATNPELFRRAFDVSLLAGAEDRACQQMRATRGVDIAAQTRIFCAARAGDWSGANLTLATESALGGIEPVQSELLARFLDPEPFEDMPLPAAPKPVTPLIWRLYDALGETLPTGTLPLAFAHAELSDRAGWKAQAEAAERLTRASVLSPNQLLGIYTARKPAASGGVWDRIAAFQAFDLAYSAQNSAGISKALPRAYAAAKEAELEVPFAALFAEGLADMRANGADFGAQAGDIAYELGLLSPAYERLAATNASGGQPNSARHALLAGLARGDVAGLAGTSALGRAVAAGFAAPALPDDLAQLAQSGAVGMATLAAIARIQAGIYGEARALTEGLALLRVLGLETAARRTALELMILERRG